jgi:hypothetical protein
MNRDLLWFCTPFLAPFKSVAVIIKVKNKSISSLPLISKENGMADVSNHNGSCGRKCLQRII